jgi:hypothetical protein
MRFVFGVMSFLAVSLGAVGAHATSVSIPPMDVMAHRSDVIVEAVVRSQEVVMDNRRIVTRTTLEVLDGMKGKAKGDVVVVDQIGGELNGVKGWIAGAHHFQIGEQAVLFAVKLPSSDQVVLYGIGFGLFSTKENGQVREEIGDVVNFRRTSTGLVPAMAEKRTYANIAALKQNIADILERKPPAEAVRLRDLANRAGRP